MVADNAMPITLINLVTFSLILQLV